MARHVQPLVLTAAEPAGNRLPKASSQGITLPDLSDPRLGDYLHGGAVTASGALVNVRDAMQNTAVWRSVSLISFAIGMLPLQLLNQETKEKADGNPIYRLLHREPNNWQTAFDFRTLMQLRALVRGNAYALIIRSRGEIIRLVPLDPDRMTVGQNSDWSLSYKFQPLVGSAVTYASNEIFHLRGMSFDGILGISLVHQAREAIGLALQAERATARIFKNGSFVDGVLQTDKHLGQEAFDRLKSSWDDRYTGADNAGKTPILEEGLKYQAIATSAKDAQSLETRKLQIEEVARVFGVPRPLLMVDETSWGSGIEALGQFFVTHALQPWFGFSKVYNDRVIGSGWVGETAARPQTTNPGLTLLPFSIGELYANPAATQDLLEDSEIDVADWLSNEVDTEFARQEGIAFLSGDGVNKPKGLLVDASHPFGVVASVASGTAAKVSQDDVINLIYALPSAYTGNARFLMNRNVQSAIRLLKDGQGRYIWQPTYTAGQPATLAGYPITEAPDMPNIATGAIPIVFGDFEQGYLIIDRIGTTVLRDPFSNKPYVMFYTRKRVGGGINEPEAMKYLTVS